MAANSPRKKRKFIGERVFLHLKNLRDLETSGTLDFKINIIKPHQQ